MKNSTIQQAPENALPADRAKNVTRFEYICLMLARIGDKVFFFLCHADLKF